MKKFTQLNEGYQIFGLDTNEFTNELKSIGTNIQSSLSFLKLNFDGSIYRGDHDGDLSGYTEFTKYSLSSPQSIEDESNYLFVPHFYFNFKLIKFNYDKDPNFINSSSDNINFAGAYSIFPFLEQLGKLKDILKKYEDNYHILLYDTQGGDAESILRIPESFIMIELLGRDPIEAKSISKINRI